MSCGSRKFMVGGSRSIIDKNWIFSQIEKYWYWHLACYEELTLIQGGARGVDKISKEYAQENDLKIEEHLAEWEKFGKAAGHIRNEEMIKESDEVLLLWDGESHGTKNDIELCEKYKKPYTLVYYPSGRYIKKNY